MAEKNLQSITFPGLTDKYIIPQVDETLSNAGRPADAKATGDELASKANESGTYPNLTAGNAQQLESSIRETDRVPYNYRTAGGTLEIGDREYDTVVGGSVVWNQQMRIANGEKTDRGITATINSSGLITLTGESTTNFASVFTNLDAVKDHVYLVMYSINTNPNNVDIRARAFNIGWTAGANMCKASASVSSAFGVDGFVAETNLSGITLYVNLSDLTDMLGSTIADYIYTLETATAGSGIAKLKSWGFFLKDYYPYSANTMESVQVSEHRMAGRNAYNSETGKAMVIGGHEYKIEGTYTGLSLDGDTITPVSGLFTPSHNGELTVTGGGADTCVFIHWDDTMDGIYEPYTVHSYPLDSSLILRGKPMLDANNELYFDGDVYHSDGTVSREYEERAYQSGDEELPNAITNGTVTVVKLSTPTTETAEPFTSPQIVDNWGTEEYVDAGTRDFNMPVGHSTEYPISLKDKIEASPNNPASDGVYVLKYENGVASYVPLESVLPETE